MNIPDETRRESYETAKQDAAARRRGKSPPSYTGEALPRPLNAILPRPALRN